MPYSYFELLPTVVETPLFSRLWPDYWTEDERTGFAAWLAANPDAGDVVPGSGGCRKLRWLRPGMGKRGGVRVIYVQRPVTGTIWLLLIYAKNVQDSIAPDVLQRIARELA